MSSLLRCGHVCLGIALVTMASLAASPSSWIRDGRLQWTSEGPLIAPQPAGGLDWHAIKDSTVVQHDGAWHLLCTVRGKERSHGIVHLTFQDWARASEAKPNLLICHPGFFCAPQVFYFEPHGKWYLICQGSDENWEPKYGACFSTTTQLADPGSWSPLQPMRSKKAGSKAGLDYWVICDETHAHLFFTTLDGHVWREETRLEDFPFGWSEPEVAIRGDLFEASHTYRILGSHQYVTVVEAQNGHGWRYFKAYLAPDLRGPWEGLADTRERSFASLKNLSQPNGTWTEAVSHGEFLRAGMDQRLELDPKDLVMLIQGALDRDRRGKPYGEIPWNLGLIKSVPSAE